MSPTVRPEKNFLISNLPQFALEESSAAPVNSSSAAPESSGSEPVLRQVSNQ